MRRGMRCLLIVRMDLRRGSHRIVWRWVCVVGVHLGRVTVVIMRWWGMCILVRNFLHP